jgi:hypothetical protein
MKRLRTDPVEIPDEGEKDEWDEHKGHALLYLALNCRKGVAFDAKCFMKLTKRRFDALVTSLEEGNTDEETVLYSFEVDDLECPLSREDLKYSVLFDTDPEEYKKFWNFVTSVLQDKFTKGSELRIVV